jgi:molybdate transport system regulatory protein
MKLSARNQLNGTVKKVTTGPVGAEVIVSVGDGVEVAAMITAGSAKAMKLKKGMTVCAVIKASDVMIAACDNGPDCSCGMDG